MSAPATLRQYSLAAVVAVGLAAIWCVLVAWVVGMVQTAALQSTSYEQPYFRMDGEPVILRYPSGVRSTTQEVVDLSGQVTKANASQLLAPQQIIPRANAGPDGIGLEYPLGRRQRRGHAGYLLVSRA